MQTLISFITLISKINDLLLSMAVMLRLHNYVINQKDLYYIRSMLNQKVEQGEIAESVNGEIAINMA